MRFAKYQETKDILLQKIKPSPLISEFADWFYQEYFARLLNIDIFVFSPHSSDIKYSLSLIIESRTGSFKSGDLSTERRINIKDKFIELSEKHNFANDHKINNKDNFIKQTTKRSFPQIKNFTDIEHLSLCFFYEAAKAIIIEETLKEKMESLKKKYPEIFKLQCWQNNIAVIYHTDAQIAENTEKNVNNAIMNDCFEYLKKYDELNLFTLPLTGIFLSTETLRGGNLYDYFMR